MKKEYIYPEIEIQKLLICDAVLNISDPEYESSEGDDEVDLDI